MKLVILFSTFLSLFVISFGQDIAVYEQQRRVIDESQKVLDRVVKTSENQRERPKSGLPSRNRKLSKTDIAKLTPPQEDFDRYKEFLKQKKTGIVKLLQQSNCDHRIINVNDAKCLEAIQIVGNGSRYSFDKRSYVDSVSINIGLIGENFSVWHFFNYGLITELGDISLETFDLSKDLKSLKVFAGIKNNSQIAAQRKQFEEGIEINGRLYKSNVLVKIDAAYLLRSDRYVPAYRSFEENIIVFKVIRKETDGSVVLIWKEL